MPAFVKSSLTFFAGNGGDVVVVVAAPAVVESCSPLAAVGKPRCPGWSCPFPGRRAGVRGLFPERLLTLLASGIAERRRAGIRNLFGQRGL